MDLEGFAKRLKIYAQNEHKGIGKLAEKLGMSQSQLSNYTSGQREPKASFLAKLADLQCDVTWLLTGHSYELEIKLTRAAAEHEMKQLRIEMNEIKAMVFDLKKELDRKNEELKQKDDSIEALFVELGKVIPVTSQLEALRNIIHRKY